MLLHHSEAFNTKAYFSPHRTNYLGVKHLFTAPAAPQPGCEAAQLFQFLEVTDLKETDLEEIITGCKHPRP